MRDTLILIDGSSLLSTSFYGNLPFEYMSNGDNRKLLRTSDGTFTNGVFTMTKKILSIIEEQSPKYFAIAWDLGRNGTFRRIMYPLYKSNRKETPAELKEQFQTMQNLLRDMNIPQYMFKKYEADDILGSLVHKFEDTLSTFVLTKDQDALQLISENTRVWLMTDKAKDMYKERKINIKEFNIPDNVFEYTVLTFEEVYGLKPIQIIDKKALEGDKSDNIPGIKGLGEKSVSPLLQEFGTVENIYKNIENMSKEEEIEFKDLLKRLGISRSPLANLLKKPEKDDDLVGKDAAMLSKKLATIVRDIEELQDVTLEDLELKLNYEKMYASFKLLEFKSLLEDSKEYAKNESDVVVYSEPSINKPLTVTKVVHSDTNLSVTAKVKEEEEQLQETLF